MKSCKPIPYSPIINGQQPDPPPFHKVPASPLNKKGCLLLNFV